MKEINPLFTELLSVAKNRVIDTIIADLEEYEIGEYDYNDYVSDFASEFDSAIYDLTKMEHLWMDFHIIEPIREEIFVVINKSYKIDR